MREHDAEPVAGLPERPPAGERILWQGAPRWRALALRVFHVRAVAVYFGILMAWRVAAALAGGGTAGDAALAAVWLVPVAAAGLGLLVLLAWLTARSTLYTITSRRIVLRFGIALPMALNLPFKVIDSAALRTCRDGTGDIPVTLTGPDRVSYLHLWPHVRPWHLARPQPMLRGLAEPEKVARILADALLAAAGAGEVRTARAAPAPATREPAPQPLPAAA